MYYNEFIQIIEKILSGKMNKKHLEEYLDDSLDCERIYESDDLLLTDVFFSLKHYASGEEVIEKDELLYFKECLLGRRKYDLDEKMT